VSTSPFLENQPPQAIVVNGESQPLPPGGTLDEVLAAAGLAGRPGAIEVDGEVVPRSGFADRRLAGGERIEIVTFVGGG
jgi:sulfur carrier protein